MTHGVVCNSCKTRSDSVHVSGVHDGSVRVVALEKVGELGQGSSSRMVMTLVVVMSSTGKLGKGRRLRCRKFCWGLVLACRPCWFGGSGLGAYHFASGDVDCGREDREGLDGSHLEVGAELIW